MNNHLDNRQIRVFISSTFKDLQEERDYLITKVFPLLQAEAEKRDTTVTPLDLRWGITEDDAKSGKVLQICLQEIENSHPFFIGIIGNRYGWCPPKEELEKNEILKERWGDWLERDLTNGLSVTEMEIQYGVLRSKNGIKAHFYFKKGGNVESDNEEKLEKLKNTIRKDDRYPVNDYSSPEELGELIKESFMEMLNELYPTDSLSVLERDRNSQRAFLHSRTEVYIPKEENFEVLDFFLNNPEQSHFVVTGESGMGKSALIANWILRHQDDADRNIVYHFVGSSNVQGNYQQIALRLSREISDIYNLSVSMSSDSKKPEDILQDCFYSVAGKKPLVIVLDGINQIADENGAKQLNWLPQAPKNVKFLFSTLNDDITMETFYNRNYLVYTIHSLDAEQKKELVGKYLRKYGKSLPDHQVDHIISAPICANTLVLRTLLDELVNFGCHERLSERINYYLTSDCSESFFQRVLNRFEEDFDVDLVREVFGLIAVSKNGLSENEILGIVGLDSQIEWSQLYCAIRNHLTIHNGLINFGHQFIQDAVTSRYADNLLHMRKEIVNSFKDVHTGRAYDELPYQYYKLGDKESLNTFLVDFKVFDYLYEKDEYELGNYWKFLSPYSLMQYLFVESDNASKIIRLYNVGIFARDIMGDYSVACEFLKNATIVIKHQFGENSIETADVYSTYGRMLLDLNRYKEAKKYLSSALTTIEGLTDSNSNERIQIYNLMGDYHYKVGEFAKCDEYHEKSIEIKDKKGVTTTLDKYYVQLNLGEKYLRAGNYTEALPHLNNARDLIKGYGGLTTMAASTVFCFLGVCYKEMHELETALSYYSKAIDIKKSHLGKAHLEIIELYVEIGGVLSSLHRTKEAEKYFELASDILSSKKGDPFWLLRAKIEESRGDLYCEEKMFDVAISLYDSALTFKSNILPQDHIEIAITFNRMGAVLLIQQKYQEALNCFRKVLPIDLAAYGPNNPEVAKAYSNISLACLYLGQNEDAKHNCEKAISITELLFGKESQEYGMNMYLMGKIYEKMNKLYQALAHYDIAMGIMEKVLGDTPAATKVIEKDLLRVQSLLGL